MEIFLGSLFIIVCILLVVVVLLQKGRGGGLGAAFGGSASSAFGTRTGDVFTWVTIVLTSLFLLLAIGTQLIYRPEPSTVPLPQFSPPAGDITESQRIRISVPGEREVRIFYTTDGTTPTEDSEEYIRIAVKVDPAPGQSVTVKAIGTKNGWKNSTVAEATYSRPGPKTADANTPATDANTPAAMPPALPKTPEPNAPADANAAPVG